MHAVTWFNDLLFASDAKILALTGGGFLVVAGVALLMERRRLKRREIDRVGWIPWTGVFISCAFLGAGMLASAIPSLLAS